MVDGRGLRSLAWRDCGEPRTKVRGWVGTRPDSTASIGHRGVGSFLGKVGNHLQASEQGRDKGFPV